MKTTVLLFEITQDNAKELQRSYGKKLCEKAKRFGKFLSLSHSGKYVAAAAADIPVGVDVQIRADVHTEKIARRFFSEGEMREWEGAQNRQEAFFFIWCKKEALYKSMSPQPHTVRGADTAGKKFTCIKLPDAFLAATGNAEIICLHDL